MDGILPAVDFGTATQVDPVMVLMDRRLIRSTRSCIRPSRRCAARLLWRVVHLGTEGQHKKP